MRRRRDAVLERLAYATEGQVLVAIVELALVSAGLLTLGRILHPRPTPTRGAT